MTAVLCAKFQRDSLTKKEAMDKKGFVKFDFHILDRISIL